MSRRTRRSLFLVLIAPVFTALSACAPIYARSFSARLAEPNTFDSVCPTIEAHAGQRGDRVRRGCAAPAGPDGNDAFIARQGDRITYRIDSAAGGQELSYLIRTRAPPDPSWGSDNAEAELDLLEAEHRSVLEAAVNRAAVPPVEVGEPAVEQPAASESVAVERSSEGGGAEAAPAETPPAPAEKGATFRVAGVIAPATPRVPDQLFGVSGGAELDGGRLGLRFWSSESFGLEFGGAFLATSINDATAIRLGGHAGLLFALASSNDARIFLQPEVGMTILAADGMDSTVGFHLGLAFGAEVLIARRGFPVIGLSARIMSGFEHASVDSPIAGFTVDATTFGLIRGGAAVAVYFNKP